MGFVSNFQKPLAKYLGIRVDGVGTNKLAGALRLDRAVSPEVAEIIQAIIDKGYNDFITLAAKARKTTPEKVHEIAQGRIWSGKDALELGLVNRQTQMLTQFNDPNGVYAYWPYWVE